MLLASRFMTDESAAPALPDWPVFIGVAVDTTDPDKLAEFWSLLLEVPIEHRTDQEVHLARQPHRGVAVAFQRVPDPTEGKNRVHLDLLVKDLASARTRALDLGAGEIAEHTRDGFHWLVVADPDGNQFCLIQAPPD
jgi:catechol 2,3-dioxygenase-like lactoylglutathione lyase family enzyme